MQDKVVQLTRSLPREKESKDRTNQSLRSFWSYEAQEHSCVGCPDIAYKQAMQCAGLHGRPHAALTL
eukprot:2141821-Rhodomonas_salina.1